MTLFNNALYASIIDYDFFFSKGISSGRREEEKLFHLNLSVSCQQESLEIIQPTKNASCITIYGDDAWIWVML